MKNLLAVAILATVISANAKPAPISFAVDQPGSKSIASPATVSTLTSDRPRDEYSFPDPARVASKNPKFEIMAPQFDGSFPGPSVAIFRLKLET